MALIDQMITECEANRIEATLIEEGYLDLSGTNMENDGKEEATKRKQVYHEYIESITAMETAMANAKKKGYPNKPRFLTAVSLQAAFVDQRSTIEKALAQSDVEEEVVGGGVKITRLPPAEGGESDGGKTP